MITLRCHTHPDFDGETKPEFSCSACHFIRAVRQYRDDAAKYLEEDCNGPRWLQVADVSWVSA